MNKIIVWLSLVTIISSCSRSNLLTYKNKKYYHEDSLIISDSLFTLNQQVCYNHPGIIDDEFCYSLRLTFIDTTIAKTKGILDLKSDSLIVKAEYGVISVWNWSEKNNVVSGQIEILKWNNDEVLLKEKVLIEDRNTNENKKFVGISTYNRQEGW